MLATSSLTELAVYITIHTVHVTIKSPTNACAYEYGNRCRNRCPTDLELASDKTGTDHTTAVGSCQECWCMSADNTYVQVKSNESVYEGVRSCVSMEIVREEMSVCVALRVTQEAAGWFTLLANCL